MPSREGEAMAASANTPVALAVGSGLLFAEWIPKDGEGSVNCRNRASCLPSARLECKEKALIKARRMRPPVSNGMRLGMFLLLFLPATSQLQRKRPNPQGGKGCGFRHER
jgi:hypothetical protein